jgi:hypothetical protein
MLKIFPHYLSTHMTSPDEVLLHVLCFLVPPQLPVPLFAPALPRGLVAVADNLLDTANVDLLLLPLPMPKNGNSLWWTCSNPCRHSCDHVSFIKKAVVSFARARIAKADGFHSGARFCLSKFT